jgi:L-amino acid N-acyltransferase YncA
MIRDVTAQDAGEIAAIYNHYIEHTTITFEENCLSASEISARIRDLCSRDYPWLVYELDGRVIGYAYAAPWRTRSAYRFTVESAVYVDYRRVREGIGGQLYDALFRQLAETGFKTVLGLIALPNEQSVRMHQSFGFVPVGHHHEVGFKFEQWIDVGVWQLRLSPPTSR